jgi:hypothetical protein
MAAWIQSQRPRLKKQEAQTADVMVSWRAISLHLAACRLPPACQLKDLIALLQPPWSWGHLQRNGPQQLHMQAPFYQAATQIEP